MCRFSNSSLSLDSCVRCDRGPDQHINSTPQGPKACRIPAGPCYRIPPVSAGRRSTCVSRLMLAKWAGRNLLSLSAQSDHAQACREKNSSGSRTMKPLTVRAHISPSQPHSASSVRCREGACVPRAVLDSFWPSDPVIAALPLWQRERATVGLHVCGEGWKGYFISYRQTGSNYSNLQMQLSEVAREKRGEEPTARKEEREKEKNLWIQLSAGGPERSRAAGWASNAVTGRVLPCEATVSGGSRSSNHTHTHTLFCCRGKDAASLQGSV